LLAAQVSLALAMLAVGDWMAAPAGAASAPVANPDSYSTGVNRTLSVRAPGVLANDVHAASARKVTNPSKARSFTLKSNGSFTYAPKAGFHGRDTFAYRAVNGGTTSAPTTVTIIVDDPPVARGDSYTVSARKALSVGPPGVLANDSDPNRDQLSAVRDTGVSLGSLSAVSKNGSFSYRSRAGVCNRNDHFTYESNDGLLFSAQTTVTIKVRTPRQSTRLSLYRPKRIVYGHSARLTAHLSRFSRSAVVRVYGRPYRGKRRLIRRGRPDSHGNLHVRVSPHKRTAYHAYSTDNCYLRGDSGPRIVQVAPIVRGHMVGAFTFRKGYALYHGGGRAPLYRATVRPNHMGSPVRFVWQRRVHGTWKGYYSSRFHLGAHSRLNVYLTSGVVRDRRYRVRIKFLADKDHLARLAHWSYFMAI
jgi:hypothetical protein